MTNQDRIVKSQAILREQETEFRRKQIRQVPKGPGNTCVGSIFDCNRKSFERMLKGYWDRLYVGWNPFKNEGRGCWEVWSRPSKKTATLEYEDTSGLKFYKLDYKPNDYEHWVADLDYLHYGFIEKLKKMDSWENKQLVSDHDYEYTKYQDKEQQKEDDNIKYVVRHNKQLFKDLLEYTQQGYDPLQFFRRG